MEEIIKLRIEEIKNKSLYMNKSCTVLSTENQAGYTEYKADKEKLFNNIPYKFITINLSSFIKILKSYKSLGYEKITFKLNPESLKSLNIYSEQDLIQTDTDIKYKSNDGINQDDKIKLRIEFILNNLKYTQKDLKLIKNINIYFEDVNKIVLFDLDNKSFIVSPIDEE